MALNKKAPEGTVLLRQAEPKYNFIGRKLPKTLDEVSQEKTNNDGVESLTSKDFISSALPTQSTINTTDSSKMPKQFVDCNHMSQSNTKPVAVVGASFQARTSSAIGNNTTFSRGPMSDHRSTLVDSSSQQAFTNIGSLINRNSIPVPAPVSTGQRTSSSTAMVLSSHSTVEPEPTDPTTIVDSSAAAAALSNVTSVLLAERLQEVEKERDCLKKDLDAQLQVNGELKRLLVASVGDDLGKRVERLAQDRVQLSMDLGGFSKKMSEDYENLDKMSIQADMWRSKYLASRVMVEELGNARAYFSLQLHESQEALQQMLNERHELRTNLLEAYKILQQVKDAFDPLNSHRSSSLHSTNVLDLSRACQQLGEAVRFRLLPAHVASSCTVEVDVDSWENSVTRAEQYAHEVLSRPSEPTGSLQSGSSSVLPVTRSLPSSQINRFHPHVKHENVTIHCIKCKGEIRVV